MNWVKKTTLSGLVCLLGTVFSFAQSDLRKAQKYLEIQEFENAIEQLESIVAAQPENQTAYLALGHAFWLTNELQQSKLAYERASNIGTLPIEKNRSYGNVLMALKEYPQALEQYSIYGTENEDSARMLIEKCGYAIEHAGDLPSFAVKEEFINTTKRDFNPAFFKDDIIYLSNRLDFTSEKSKLTNSDVSIELLKVSHDAKGMLKFPKKIKGLTDAEFNIISISYNTVLGTVAVTKGGQFDNVHLTAEDKCTLYIGKFDKHGAIQNLKPYEFNQTDYSTGFASFSDDGMTMYFASDRLGGNGGFDLYESQMMGGSWSAPINLGSEINSEGNEITPFPLGGILIFASDSHPGFGGYDLYQSIRNEEGYNGVKNLGTGINTSFDEYGMIYSADRDYGYITSNRAEGKGLEDIYHIHSIDALDLENSEIARAESTKTNDQPYEILKGMTVDQVSGLPIPGTEVFASSDEENTIISAKTNSKGMFSIPLEAGKYYTLKFKSPIHLQSSRTVKMESTKKMSLMQVEMITKEILASADEPTIKPVTLGSTSKRKREAHSTEKYESPLKEAPMPKIEDSKTEEKEIKVSEVGLSTYSAPAVVKAFAIQLAAISKNAGTQNFKNVKDLGSVYTLFDSKIYKIRCGLYSSREQAEEVLRRVKVRGYESAFIVEEKPSDNMDLVMMDFSNNAQSEISVPKPTRQAISSLENRTKETPVSTYKVRLATYTNSKWFDGSKVEGDGFGYVEIIMNEKGQSIYLLAGFISKQAAIKAREMARKNGFIDAILVQDENGELKKID